MSDDDKTTRAELIDARDSVKRHIEILENPMRATDAYPEGVAKLRATLAEIESCLAEMESVHPQIAAPSEPLAYSVAFSLYTANGSRGIEVRVRRDGRAYFVEMEHVEGTIWKERGHGDEIGPYESPEAAEAAAIAGPWFTGGYSSN